MTWRVAGACLLALSPLYAQESTTAAGDSDSVVVVRPLTKYGILRTHLPDSEGAPQVAVSHARYIANFGTRAGVKPKSPGSEASMPCRRPHRTSPHSPHSCDELGSVESDPAGWNRM